MSTLDATGAILMKHFFLKIFSDKYNFSILIGNEINFPFFFALRNFQKLLIFIIFTKNSVNLQNFRDSVQNSLITCVILLYFLKIIWSLIIQGGGYIC